MEIWWVTANSTFYRQNIGRRSFRMIITQKKPIGEVLALVEGAKTVALVGCNSCATACQTGGQPQIDELTKILEGAGKKVVATTICD